MPFVRRSNPKVYDRRGVAGIDMLGFVNVLKPVGPTSTHVGTQVRRIYTRAFGAKLPVGHLGTLDPGASGVLPLALGKATRLIPLLEDRRKSYVFDLVLGTATDTGDASGTVVRESAVPADARALLEVVLPRFIGAIEQVPPMYSAVHHAGRRLYELAREGRTVERASRKVTIYGLTLLGYENGTVRLSCACSEGTYIRTLCEDLGAAIGCPGHMAHLLRDASGPFVLYESWTIDAIEAAPAEALIRPIVCASAAFAT